MKDIDLNDIDFNNMGSWPVAGKVAFVAIVCLLILILGYFIDLSGQLTKLEGVEQYEQKLKNDFRTNYMKAVNLDAYKAQLKDMEDSFGAMLRQLPSKSEVDDLLVDISQTGLSSGVEFTLFKPEKEKFVDFYAELPIKISMTGDYHQFGNFVSGVAALPRIVTLHDIEIKSEKTNGILTMSMTAKTYRYLDPKEIAANRAAERDKKKNKGRR
ncbi:MAG: type 4a pilus biogenesis protein PilO [Gammaproteobacteria bacterium]|nr:type 4a pilus biogenesis protein PilO [Gammaproteobacteria bacterium]MDH5654004.1 type 4a pilus biogenesis protein PilO [Gammaproteobacteria bacterium]